MSKDLISVEYTKGDNIEVKFYEKSVKGLLQAVKDLKVVKAKQAKLIDDMTKAQIEEMQEHQRAMNMAENTIRKLEDVNIKLMDDMKYYAEHCKQLEKVLSSKISKNKEEKWSV